MTKFLRMPSLAAATALAVTAAPALAVGPNQNATATARIVKPLTLTWVRDLDLGTIVLSGALVAMALTACATSPPASPSSAFERCVSSVGSSQSYVSDRIKVATWCVENGNGGISR